MLIFPSGMKIHLVLGDTDMRMGFDSPAVLVRGGARHLTVISP